MAQRLGRPEPYIKNGTGAFYKQLKKLVVNYCDYGGSSKHIRFVRTGVAELSTPLFFSPPNRPNDRNYILTDLIEYAKANPSVEVAVEQRRGHHPALRGYYRTSVLWGRWKREPVFKTVHVHAVNGRDKVIGIKNLEFADIHKHVMVWSRLPSPLSPANSCACATNSS